MGSCLSIAIIISRLIAFITAYLVSRYTISRKNSFPIPKTYYIGLLMVMLGSLYLYINSLDQQYLSLLDVSISSAALIIINITIVLVDEKIYHALLTLAEKKLLKQQNSAYEQQAEIIGQSTKTINAIKHDMKNHLLLLEQMQANNKDLSPYIQQVITSMDIDSYLVQSHNFIIDSIVNFKLLPLKKQEIPISIDITIPTELNIAAYDLTVIIGNLLDNAITALEKATDKRLDLIITLDKANLLILVDNSYDGQLLKDGKYFKTTKKPKQNHGLGLANIEKSLAKYNGEMIIDYTKTIFSVSVIIPVKQ